MFDDLEGVESKVSERPTPTQCLLYFHVQLLGLSWVPRLQSWQVVAGECPLGLAVGSDSANGL